MCERISSLKDDKLFKSNLINLKRLLIIIIISANYIIKRIIIITSGEDEWIKLWDMKFKQLYAIQLHNYYDEIPKVKKNLINNF